MKTKKIITIILCVMLTFGGAVTSYAYQTEQTLLMNPRYAAINYFSGSIDISGNDVITSCSLSVSEESDIVVNITIKKSSSENGPWTTYRTFTVSKNGPYYGNIEKKISSAPSGYYYAIIKVNVRTDTGIVESDISETGIIQK